MLLSSTMGSFKRTSALSDESRSRLKPGQSPCNSIGYCFRRKAECRRQFIIRPRVNEPRYAISIEGGEGKGSIQDVCRNVSAAPVKRLERVDHSCFALKPSLRVSRSSGSAKATLWQAWNGRICRMRPFFCGRDGPPFSAERHSCSLDFRYRRIRLLVEPSCLRAGSVVLSSSGMMRWASALPSSTPH
jgi:hypothetical protein